MKKEAVVVETAAAVLAVALVEAAGGHLGEATVVVVEKEATMGMVRGGVKWAVGE